ncbi:MAG: hypothetical protein RR276_02940 [Angelakisella sp.]
MALHSKYMDIIFLDFIGDFPAMIGALVAFSVAVFGINVTRQGIFNKGGTPYYKKEIPQWQIRKIIRKDAIVRSYSEQSKYDKVCKIIASLQNEYTNAQNGEKQSLYYKYVFFLQNSNLAFCKIWNNNEYASTNYERNGSQIEYVYNLKKYIFCHVYTAYMKDKNEIE